MNDDNIRLILGDLKIAFVGILQKIDLDKSNFVKNTTFNYSNGLFEILMPPYVQYIESGRNKGAKQPPIGAIIDYIRDKNIKSLKGTSEKQLAFAIARSISIKGVKPRPFLEQLQKEINEILLRYLNELVVEELRFMLETK